jgi:hypothetical protein
VTKRLTHFGKRQIARVSKKGGTKHFLRITKNAWIVAQFQCESTFIPHIADCDYARHSLTTGILLGYKANCGRICGTSERVETDSHLTQNKTVSSK